MKVQLKQNLSHPECSAPECVTVKFFLLAELDLNLRYSPEMLNIISTLNCAQLSLVTRK